MIKLDELYNIFVSKSTYYKSKSGVPKYLRFCYTWESNGRFPSEQDEISC